MALIINCTRNFRQVVFGSMHLPKNLPNKGKKNVCRLRIKFKSKQTGDILSFYMSRIHHDIGKENCDSIKSCIFVYFEILRPYYNSFGALEIIIGLGF